MALIKEFPEALPRGLFRLFIIIGEIILYEWTTRLEYLKGY